MTASNETPVAVITGAASGMGAASVERLKAEGWIVAGVDRAGGEGIYECDITSLEQVEATVAKILADHGRIDALVNAAGSGFNEPFLETKDETWLKTMDVNLMGTVRMCRAALPALIATGNGAIVNFSSQAGKTGGLGIGSHYPAAKAAVISLTKSLAREFSPQGVRVNAIAPGVIDTPFLDSVPSARDAASIIPLRRLGEASEAAAVVNFLVSSESSYLSGEIIDVNGGLVMD